MLWYYEGEKHFISGVLIRDPLAFWKVLLCWILWLLKIVNLPSLPISPCSMNILIYPQLRQYFDCPSLYRKLESILVSSLIILRLMYLIYLLFVQNVRETIPAEVSSTQYDEDEAIYGTPPNKMTVETAGAEFLDKNKLIPQEVKKVSFYYN